MKQFSRRIAGFFAMFFCGLFSLDAQAQQLGFDELKNELGHVLELITKRRLSDEEIERAAGEFHAHFDDDCGPACMDAVAMNKRLVEPMATQPGSPRDLLARQWLSGHLYFSPAQSGSFIQSLADEVDPIRLADAKSGRVMTHGDVLGLMNINHFLQNGGEPAERFFSTDEVEAHVDVFQKRYVEGRESLPYRAALAAELWAGVHQNWDKLDGRQKNAVVAYLSDRDFKAGLDISTYQVLLGLNQDEAIAQQSDNQTAQLNARLEWVTLRSLQVTEAASHVRSDGSYCFFCR